MDNDVAPADFCIWCCLNIARGRLIALPADDAPRGGGDLPAWRLCYKCGWHFHGGKGISGDYVFVTDKDTEKPMSALERVLLEEDEDYDG